MCSAGDVALGVQARRHLALRDRVVTPCSMSSSRDQISLTGVPGICRAISHGLAHPVVHRAAPAKTAAQVLVDLALRCGQAGGLGARPVRLRRSAWGPDLAALGRVSARWRSSAPWSRGSGAGSCTPPRWCGAPRQRRPASPFWLPTAASGRPARPSAPWQMPRWRPWRAGLRPTRSAARPARSWRATRCRRPPPPRCRPRAPPCARPGASRSAAALKLLTLPPNTGQSLMAALSMPGSCEVHAVDCLPVVLSTVSSRARRLPASRQSLGSFSGTSAGRRQLGGGRSDLAIGGGAAAGRHG
jgi:hypothetical protein